MPIASVRTTLAAPAEALINWLEGIGLGWGFAIIIATFVVRVIVSPFAYRQIRSMGKFKAMGDDVKKIREHHGDDVVGMTTSMEKLYKDNSFHPFSFVLPALLQAPFFTSVFFYLNSASFKNDIGANHSFLFVDDLTRATSSSSTTFLGLVGAYLGVQILIVLFQNEFKPEKKALMIGIGIPAFITVFLIHFPAALMLYWTAGVVALLIQQIIMKAVVNEPEIVHWTAPKGSKKTAPKVPAQNPFAKALADAQATRAAHEAHHEDPRGSEDGGPVETEGKTVKKPHPSSKKRKHGSRRR